MVQRDCYLRFVSVSHRTAPVASRERYHLAMEAKGVLTDVLVKCFPDLSSLLLLVTCNRTEIYFESITTSAFEVRDKFLEFVQQDVDGKEQQLFVTSDQTEDTVKHLLRVAAGLESSVLGDAEILHQVKKAYHFSLERGLQGSLLERAVQTVFRSHKRISNETGFRDGTTSTAYKALKLVANCYGPEAQNKKILFVGAGDIVLQLLKYNAKFGYQNVWIANRTSAKVTPLVNRYALQLFPWEGVLEQQFSDFDVIISAVSNRAGLIRKGVAKDRQIVLVDLAVPGNIDPGLQQYSNVVFSNLDNIACHLEETRATRMEAVEKVEDIIREEWQGVMNWYRQQAHRELLAMRKRETMELLQKTPILADHSPKELDILADQLIRKMLKEPKSLQEPSKVKEMVRRMIPVTYH